MPIMIPNEVLENVLKRKNIYEIPKPTAILTASRPGTGKTVTTQAFCIQTRNTAFFCKEESDLAQQRLKFTSQGQLPSMKDYLGFYASSTKDEEKLELSPFLGDFAFKVPFASEFNGRHFTIGTLGNLIAQAELNLRLGKSPVIDNLGVVRRLKDGCFANILSYFSERSYPNAVLFFRAEPSQLWQRMYDRGKDDPYTRERDKPILGESPESIEWKTHLSKQPVGIEEMKFFSHLVVDTSNPNKKSLEDSINECVEKIVDYVISRSRQRDELLYRVDETGKVLGAVHYSVAHQKGREGIRHLAVNTFVYRTPEGKEILLELRKKVNRPGIWCVPGGQVTYQYPSLEDYRRLLAELSLDIASSLTMTKEQLASLEARSRQVSVERAVYESIEREISEEIFNKAPIPKDMKFKEVYRVAKQTRPEDAEFEIMYETVCQGPFQPGEEVSELRWFNISELRIDISKNPEKYANSLRIQLENLK